MMEFTASAFANLTASADFSTLTAGLLVPAPTIGFVGDINITAKLPSIGVNAVLSRSLTAAGWIVMLASPVVICYLLPLFCGAAVTLAILLAFVLNNLSALSVVFTNVGVTLDVQYKWNNVTNLVDPFVTVVSTSGSATVTSVPMVPNIIAAVFDEIVVGIGNLFNVWTSIFAQAMAGFLQKALRARGLSFPAGQVDLQAVFGDAISISNTLLILRASLQSPRISQYVTQVDLLQNISDQLTSSHQLIRGGLNPQQPPPPGPGAAIQIGTYLGLGISQNALDFYLFQRWRRGDFDIEINDNATIQSIISAAPPNAIGAPIERIRIWPAIAPRIEVSIGRHETTSCVFRRCASLHRCDGGGRVPWFVGA